MKVQDLSSKDRALFALKALLINATGIQLGSSVAIARGYVISKIEDCIGNPFPERMLDERNRKTFDKLLEEVK